MGEQEIQKLHQYIGELYGQLRMSKDFYEDQLRQKDTLVEQLKNQIFQLQKKGA
jgi:hypothetical protein